MRWRGRLRHLRERWSVVHCRVPHLRARRRLRSVRPSPGRAGEALAHRPADGSGDRGGADGELPHREQVQRQVERARAEGAELLCGGTPPHDAALRAGALLHADRPGGRRQPDGDCPGGSVRSGGVRAAVPRRGRPRSSRPTTPCSGWRAGCGPRTTRRRFASLAASRPGPSGSTPIGRSPSRRRSAASRPAAWDARRASRGCARTWRRRASTSGLNERPIAWP